MIKKLLMIGLFIGGSLHAMQKEGASQLYSQAGLQAAKSCGVSASSAFLPQGNSELSSQNERLCHAVVAKNIQDADFYLTHCVTNVDCIDPVSQSPLLNTAVSYGDLPMVDLLLEHGANVNQTAADGLTPLIIASTKGDVKTVERLIQEDDINLSLKCKGRTAYDGACIGLKVETDASRKEPFATIMQMLEKAEIKQYNNSIVWPVSSAQSNVSDLDIEPLSLKSVETLKDLSNNLAFRLRKGEKNETRWVLDLSKKGLTDLSGIEKVKVEMEDGRIKPLKDTLNVTLDVSGNKLKRISSAIKSLPRLKGLDISSNEMKENAETILKGNPHLLYRIKQ